MWGRGELQPGSIRQSTPPVVVVSTVVFDSQDSNLIRTNTKVNGIGKLREEVQPQVAFHDPPLAWRVLNLSNRTLESIQKLSAESGETILVELG